MFFFILSYEVGWIFVICYCLVGLFRGKVVSRYGKGDVINYGCEI